jgi:hypothetical protein
LIHSHFGEAAKDLLCLATKIRLDLPLNYVAMFVYDCLHNQQRQEKK